jgi:O-antigen/teichoic acid export membrane protein
MTRARGGENRLPDEPPIDVITSRDVAKGAGTTLLARMGGIIEVVVQPLLVWMFGLATFGIYAVLWSAINLIENIADLGMTSALQRTIPQAKSPKEAVSALRAAIIMGVGPCLIIAAIISFMAPSLVNLFNAAPADQADMALAIRVFIWSLPLWAFVEIATSALRAKRAFGPEIRLRVLWEQIARFVFAAILWLAGVTTMALFYAHLASLAVVSLLSIRLLGQYFDLKLFFEGPVIDRPWRETMKAGFAVLPNNLVGRLFVDAPPLVLNTLMPGTTGATAAGLYVIARKVSSIVQLVRTAFSYVMAPLASLASTGKRESIQDIYAFATRVSIAIVVPLGATLAAGSDAILATFGNGADAALPALVILIIARMIEAAFGNAAPIQQVIGGYKGQLVGSFVGLIFALVIGALVMPSGGLTGIALAVGVGQAVAALVPAWQVHHFDKLHPFAKPFGVVALRACGIALASLFAGLAIHIFPVIMQLPLLLVLLMIALWLSARASLPLEDRQALGKAGRKLKLI